MQPGPGHFTYQKSLKVCCWNLLLVEVTRQAFAGLQPQCCVFKRPPAGEEWKLMRSSEKLIFRATEIGRVMKIGRRERFKLTALSSGKSYKWRVNVNILNRKIETHQSHLGKDWIGITNTQGRVLWDSFLGVHPSEMPKLIAIEEHRAQPRSPWVGISWGRTMRVDPNVFSLWSCLGTTAYKSDEDEGQLGKSRYLKTFEDFFSQ